VTYREGVGGTSHHLGLCEGLGDFGVRSVKVLLPPSPPAELLGHSPLRDLTKTSAITRLILTQKVPVTLYLPIECFCH